MGLDLSQVKKDSVNLSGKVRESVETAARLGAKFSLEKVGEQNENGEVYNINFPTDPHIDTPWVATQPGTIRFDSLFENTGSDTFNFRYMERIPDNQPKNLPDDYKTLSSGKISVSILNFNDLGRVFTL